MLAGTLTALVFCLGVYNGARSWVSGLLSVFHCGNPRPLSPQPFPLPAHCTLLDFGYMCLDLWSPRLRALVVFLTLRAVCQWVISAALSSSLLM